MQVRTPTPGHSQELRHTVASRIKPFRRREGVSSQHEVTEQTSPRVLRSRGTDVDQPSDRSTEKALHSRPTAFEAASAQRVHLPWEREDPRVWARIEKHVAGEEACFTGDACRRTAATWIAARKIVAASHTTATVISTTRGEESSKPSEK